MRTHYISTPIKNPPKHSRVLSVACPKCKADAGDFCKKTNGAAAETHSSRIDAYNAPLKPK